MSQEPEGTDTNEGTVDTAELELTEETTAVAVKEARADNRVPVEDLISARNEAKNLKEEVHNLRMLALQGAQQAQPRETGEDAVDLAFKRLKKRSGWDDGVADVMEPTMRALLEELAFQRAENAEIRGTLNHYGQRISQLTEREQAVAQNQELIRMIPDMEMVGPKILELLKDMPEAVKSMYAQNPSLLIPIAQAVRSSNGIAQPKARPNKGQLTVDTGGAPSTPLSLDSATVAALKPNSKEFEAIRRQFYGEG